MVDPGLRCTIRGDEEVDVVEVVIPMCSTEPKLLHVSVATAVSLSDALGNFQKEEKRGQRGEETMAARGRKEMGI